MNNLGFLDILVGNPCLTSNDTYEFMPVNGSSFVPAQQACWSYLSYWFLDIFPLRPLDSHLGSVSVRLAMRESIPGA